MDLLKWQKNPTFHYQGILEKQREVDCVCNMMAQAQKQDFVFRRNGRVHLNRRGRQFIRLLAAEVCASAVTMVVMLDTPCSEVVWRVLAIHSIRHFPLHFPSCASSCAITFKLDSTRYEPRLKVSQLFSTEVEEDFLGQCVVTEHNVMDYSKRIQSFRYMCRMQNGADTLTSDVGTCSLLAIERF
jgi:hypothetical protein